MRINGREYNPEIRTYIIVNDLDTGRQEQVYYSINQIRNYYQVAIFFERDGQLYVDVLKKKKRWKS